MFPRRYDRPTCETSCNAPRIATLPRSPSKLHSSRLRVIEPTARRWTVRSPHGLADALVRSSRRCSCRVRGEPGDRAALHDESVRRGGPGGALRLASAGRRARPPAARARPGLARAAARGLKRRKPSCEGLPKNNGRRPTLPGDCSPSTIGASGLNFSVRNGKRCFPAAMTAQLVSPQPARRRTLAEAHRSAPSKLHSSA